MAGSNLAENATETTYAFAWPAKRFARDVLGSATLNTDARPAP